MAPVFDAKRKRGVVGPLWGGWSNLAPLEVGLGPVWLNSAHGPTTRANDTYFFLLEKPNNWYVWIIFFPKTTADGDLLSETDPLHKSFDRAQVRATEDLLGCHSVNIAAHEWHRIRSHRRRGRPSL